MAADAGREQSRLVLEKLETKLRLDLARVDNSVEALARTTLVNAALANAREIGRQSGTDSRRAAQALCCASRWLPGSACSIPTPM